MHYTKVNSHCKHFISFLVELEALSFQMNTANFELLQ